jgi:hypothetical protein
LSFATNLSSLLRQTPAQDDTAIQNLRITKSGWIVCTQELPTWPVVSFL